MKHIIAWPTTPDGPLYFDIFDEEPETIPDIVFKCKKGRSCETPFSDNPFYFHHGPGKWCGDCKQLIATIEERTE
jgi:hypothetical protein